MIYSLSLSAAMALVGLLLVLLGCVALFRRESAQRWLRELPRSRFWGVVLMLAVAVWSFYLVVTIDLGEFDNWRTRVLVFIPIATALTIYYVDEFLAVRALGMLTLLAAEPLLESAFLKEPTSRLFLVSLVYAFIVAAMFWIGMPYTLRDQVSWITESLSRWKGLAFATIGYGVVLLICYAMLPAAL